MSQYRRCSTSSDVPRDVSPVSSTTSRARSPPEYSSLENVPLDGSHAHSQTSQHGVQTVQPQPYAQVRAVDSSSTLPTSSSANVEKSKWRIESRPTWLSTKSKAQRREDERKKPLAEQESWLLEITALACSVLSFAGLLGLLIRFNNTPLSDWTVAQFSINTPIAVFAGMSRASLALAVSACLGQFKWNWYSKYEEPLIDYDRLDAASRGPWGSLRLMRTLVRRPHWLAVGALVTVFMIAFEPFLQAVVRFEDETFVKTTGGDWVRQSVAAKSNTTVKSEASLGRSKSLTSGSYVESSTDNGYFSTAYQEADGSWTPYGQAGFDLRVDFGMSAAVWTGMSNMVRAENLSPSFECASGNCTWADFASLAVCSQCVNVTKDVVVSKGKWEFEGSFTDKGWGDSSQIPPTSNNAMWATMEYAASDKWTAHKLPQSGLNVSNWDGYKVCNSSRKNCPDTYYTSRVTTNPGQTLSFGDERAMILSIQAMQPSNSWEDNQTTWEDTHVDALECALTFCVNAYEAEAESGVLNETTTGSWSNRTPGCYYEPGRDLATEKAFTKWMNYSLAELYVARSDLQLYVPDDNSSNPFAGNKYNISQSAVVGLLNVFFEGFDVKVMTTDALNNATKYIYPSKGNDDPPRFMQGLGDNHDLVATFDNLAASLTKWIRDRELDDTPVAGRVQKTMVVMKVTWWYLAIPGSVLGLGVLFVVMSIVETKRLKLPAWKTDALVPLVHGHDRELIAKLEGAAEENELHRVSKSTRVSLRDAKGLRKLGIIDRDNAPRGWV